MVAALSKVVNDPVRPFPCGAELPLCGISGCRGNLVQDEISYVQSSEFYPFIVVVVHPLLVLCYSDGRFFSHFVQEIQVDRKWSSLLSSWNASCLMLVTPTSTGIMAFVP